MCRTFTILLLLFILTASFAFWSDPSREPATEVRKAYIGQCRLFISKCEILQSAVLSGDLKKIRSAFIAARLAYKYMETIVEYYFDFHASRLNGPPIPAFKEEEPDMPAQEPSGMQVIENLIFPEYDPAQALQLQNQTAELLRYARELPGIDPSFAFTDANIFDACMEELYRVTALGITGFDSQAAGQALPECTAALQGVEQILEQYKEAIKNKAPQLAKQWTLVYQQSIQYLSLHTDFNRFNRMQFIKACLDPLAKCIGQYKLLNNWADNSSGRYYSAIKKNGSLFSDTAFSTARFLDDFSSSSQKTELGRKFFFEKLLSANGTRSCATCHQPAKAFTDGLPVSLALDGHSPLPRNAPGLWNAALQRNLFYDSRSRNLEEQVLQVLNSKGEMHGSAAAAASTIISSNEYRELYESVYPDARPEAAAINIANAIACYERTLVSLNSRFDRHMRGSQVLNPAEVNGFNLFMGKAKCGTCHFMPLFGGAKPPRFYYTESEVIGVPGNSDPRHPQADKDSGRFLITGFPVHMYAFKTPLLRNVALTAPYMHNGVFATLKEVVDFYDKGGGKGLGIAPPNQTLAFDSLKLSRKEKQDIIAFLRCLTDTGGRY
jgi:cytochrome c peroxidase